MSERRYRVSDGVAKEARHLAATTTGVDAARLTDIGSRMPVGRVTLLALLASGVNGQVGSWATRLYSQAADTERDTDIRVLTAAGIESPCLETHYGILAPDPDVDLITNVVRVSADRLDRWTAEGWTEVDGDGPVGARYMELAGDTLTAALSAVQDGNTLLLRAGTPKAFLPRRVPLTASTGTVDGVFAVVDEVDTTAVLDVLRVTEGQVDARVDGEWAPDDQTLAHVVASGVPLALVPKADVPVLLRTVDDHDAVYPIVADVVSPDDTTPDSSTPDFSDGVMVALPLDPATADTLAVDGGLTPDDMHCTLAYLGTTDDVPVDMDGLAELVTEWAAQQAPISGEVSGPATFEGTANSDNPVQVALVDAPGLAEARQSLVDHLQSNGVPVDATHGFTPHVTRLYGDQDVSSGIGGTPLNFDTVGVWHGDDQHMIPLGGGVTAAFNPSEARDFTGKWTAGQTAQLEANRKTTAPHAAPKPKTVIAKHYHKPAGGGAGGKKAAAAKKAAVKKAAQAKKTALRKQVIAQEKAWHDAESNRHGQYLQSYMAQGIAEKQRQLNAQAAIAKLPKAQQAAALRAESAKHLAWQRERQAGNIAESKRHLAAQAKVKADTAALNAERDRQIAAIDAGTAKPPVVHASAEPVVADAVAHTRTPRQLETFWTRGKGAARIAWTTPGDYDRCVAELGKYVHSSRVVHGQCASLHKIATGIWPATHAKLIRGGK